jgi:hypothetical protein
MRNRGIGLLLFFTAGVLPAGCGRDHPASRRPREFAQYRAALRAATADSVEFSNIVSMDVDSRGNVYTGDHARLLVLSPTLRPVGTVGRQGKGPGEFEDVTAIHILPGDSIFAFDGGSARVTVFPPGSERPAHMLSMSTANLLFPHWVDPLPGGGMLAAFHPAFGDTPDGSARGKRMELLRLLNSDASVERDSLLTFPEYEAVQIDHGPFQGALFSPFGRRTLYAAAGDRVYTAWTGGATVEAYSPTGKHVATIRLADAPPLRAVTRAEMDSVVTSMQKGLPFGRQVIQRAMEGAGNWNWPLLRQLLVDDSGRIWLAVNGQRGEPVHWIAMDEQGRRVGAFDLPESVKLFVIRGDAAYGVEKNADDVQRVVAYRLDAVHARPAGRA